MSAMEQQGAAMTGSAEDLRITLAFEEFFEAERGRLFRALLLVTHDSAEVEDLIQEAVVRVWERWDRVGTLDDPVGYLFKSALNLRRSALWRRCPLLQPWRVPSVGLRFPRQDSDTHRARSKFGPFDPLQVAGGSEFG